MLKEQRLFRAFGALTVLALSTSLVGCATVKRDEFNAELAAIRGEMHEGDEGVERRTGRRIDDLENEMNTFRAEVEAAIEGLQQDFDMKLERFETALRFNAPVFFGFDEADVRPEDEPTLAQFAGVVTEYFPTALVTVEGFTDQSGTREYNMQLGQKRADAVKGYLVEQGLAPERVRTVSYGEDTRRLVVHGNPSREEAEGNRRVVLVIDHSNATASGQRVIAETRNEMN